MEPRRAGAMATAVVLLRQSMSATMAEPLKKSSPTATAAATCRSRWCCPTAAACRCRRRAEVDIVARTLAGPEGARLAGAGQPRPRLRPQRHRLHRQRAAGPRRSPRRWSARRPRPRAAARALAHLVVHQRRAQRATSRTTTTSPTRSTACGSTRAWCIRARISTDDARIARRRAGAEARPHLPQAAARAGRALARHRLRLGRADLPGRRELRRRGDRHHAVAEPVRARDAPRSPRAGSRAASSVELRDYLDLPETSQYDKIASVGMFEHVGVARLPEILRQDLSHAEARRAWC